MTSAECTIVDDGKAYLVRCIYDAVKDKAHVQYIGKYSMTPEVIGIAESWIRGLHDAP